METGIEKDIIFEPLQFRNLTVKNRIFRSNTYGNFDRFESAGLSARLKWEEKFARGGVGAILSSVVPIHPEGSIMLTAATVESDEKIPFWQQVSQTVHAYDCKYIVQLSYGRPYDSPHAFSEGLKVLSLPEIQDIIQLFRDAARRVRLAGLDGIEVDATPSGTGRLLDDLSEKNAQLPANLVAQFLSLSVNNRVDEYGGSWQNRARFLQEILTAIRQEVGDDFHLQVKVGDSPNLEEEIQLCQWIEAAGADALHAGRKIPYPAESERNDFPLDIQGEHLNRAKQIKQAVKIPVLCTGGFQTASYIRKAIGEGYCDGVTLARALIANSDLVKIFAEGKDSPDQPCTYCEKCRVNLLENPLGCYDVSRYDGDFGKMVQEIMSIYL